MCLTFTDSHICYRFYRYTVEGVSYTRLEDQSLPLSTPKVHNKFGIDDG
jgi:hypothetical protein